jgi:hypothetical protein
VIQPIVALIVLAIVFCSAILGMQVERILPQFRLADETKNLITMSMGVVATLTALVLGLLVAAASNSFNTRNQEVLQVATDVIQVDYLRRRNGPEADEVRDLLRHYIAMKIQDLFPEGTSNLPNLENLRTLSLLEEMQEKLVHLLVAMLVSAGCSRRRYSSSARFRRRDGFWSSRTDRDSGSDAGVGGILAFYPLFKLWPGPALVKKISPAPTGGVERPEAAPQPVCAA